MPIPEILHTLARLRLKHIWTTNYDELLERAWREQRLDAGYRHLGSSSADLLRARQSGSAFLPVFPICHHAGRKMTPVNRPFNCGWLSIRVLLCHRRGHGPFRGRMPHDDVRVGRLNVCNEVRSRRQPIQRGHHNHRPGGDVTGFGSGPAIGIERGSVTPSFRRPTQSWCRQPRGSGAEPRSCEQPPLSPFSCRSASTGERPTPSASTISLSGA